MEKKSHEISLLDSQPGRSTEGVNQLNYQQPGMTEGGRTYWKSVNCVTIVTLTLSHTQPPDTQTDGIS